MSDYYRDVYQRRLNRYGTDYQSRVQSQREKEFEGKLLKSVYRVDFEYEGEFHPGTLERYKQDESELMQYLLTRVSLNLPGGSVLMLPDKDGELQPWLVFWLESIKASGYNRYVVLKLTHFINWKDQNGAIQETWCCFHRNNQVSIALKESVRASSSVYTEDNNPWIMIMPVNENLRRSDYIEIKTGSLIEAYRVIGYDVHSTKGVEYAFLDPIYLQDQSATPTPKPGEDSAEYYWLTGGEE